MRQSRLTKPPVCASQHGTVGEVNYISKKRMPPKDFRRGGGVKTKPQTLSEKGGGET